MDLGKKIKELRKENKMSQERLAEILDITTGAVCKWEGGLSSPDLQNLVLLAKTFKVSVDYLLDCNLDYESRDKYLTKFKQQIKNRDFSCSFEEVKYLTKKYPNDAEMLAVIAEYLFTHGFADFIKEELEEALNDYLRAFDIIDNKQFSAKEKEKIINQILILYQRLDRPQEAIDFIERLELSHADLSLGVCYQMLGDNTKALEYLSNNMINSVSLLLNGSISEFAILYKLGRIDESLKLIDWIISIVKPLVKVKGQVLDGVVAILLAFKATIQYPNNNYKDSLIQAIELIETYNSGFVFNHDTIEFFYGNDTSIVSFSGDLLGQIKKQIKEIDSNKAEKIINELESIINEREKKRVS